MNSLVAKHETQLGELEKQNNELLKKLEIVETENKDLTASNELCKAVAKTLFARISELTVQNQQLLKEAAELKTENENLHFLRNI